MSKIKWIFAGIFGFTLGFTISAVSGYYFYNWQWWAAFLPIAIIGVLYGEAN